MKNISGEFVSVIIELFMLCMITRGMLTLPQCGIAKKPTTRFLGYLMHEQGRVLNLIVSFSSPRRR